MSTFEIEKRYGELAESQCCLSCGGAINYSEAKAGEFCLDLGSGRGNDVLRLAENVGPKGFVYGVDISDGMIEKAKHNADKFEVKNVQFIKSELEKLPFANEHIDLIISNCTLNHAGDKQAVWNEIYRVLKKGGRFVVSDIYAVNPIEEQYKNDPVAISECWAGSITKTEYMEVLEKAGFNNVKIIEESAPYEKGKALVASFTIASTKKSCCCCS